MITEPCSGGLTYFGSRRLVVGTGIHFALVQESVPVLAVECISRRFLVGSVRRSGVPYCALVGRVLGDDGVVSARHGHMVGLGRLGRIARVLVEEAHKSLVRVRVEVVDLVPPGQEIGDGARRRLVNNSRRDHVDNVAVVLLDRDVQLGVRVESAEGGQVHIAAQDGYPHRELGRRGLQSLDEGPALRLFLPLRVVVLKIVEQIDAAVELVEYRASYPTALEPRPRPAAQQGV